MSAASRFAFTLPLHTLRNAARTAAIAALIALLAACGSSPSRPSGPGYHDVRPNETLSSIARRYGASVDDLVRWNKLANPNRIHVGQTLQVVANPGKPGDTGVASGSTDSTPLATSRGDPTQVQPSAPAPRATAAVPANAVKLAWPADGKTGRMPGRSGISIAAGAGAPVRAAASGRVAYVGSGLRGYGNMVIVDHGSNFMTVYAHNRRLTVQEGARVSQGQQIAEMGSTDASQVVLYFEVRHNGEPVDPLRVLPKR
ncbi:M23 family metallopeptidase [Verticiella sediminum]|uniref:M23 family metallopeptidase n=1 Tax=Verticiella sediminum TaxID=1247510 RepID=A0A556ALS4_9BURK|nr:M23 family metallopeptidase [Verticiella sediminum]TSH93836.1 M23 family metallopeptidase [Verticiella sediminum]